MPPVAAAGEGPALAAVLFTDLVESTALRSRLGEERADELRRVHDRLLTERVQAHGGRVLKSTGDGLVAAFGSASDALTAAAEAQQALDQYGRRPDAIAALPVRMGLSVGDVSWEGGDCFGTPLVEAARLEAEAAGGQILCTDLVRALARGRGGHEFHELGFLDLKGLPEPVAACEVVWTPLPAPSPLPLPADLVTDEQRRFVSRLPELELARAVLHDPARQRAAVLWLLGEPGIGKTRLAAEVAAQAHAVGGVVLFGRCSEDLAIPYQPFIEALRWYLAHVPDHELAVRLGQFPAELTRLVPELAARLPGLDTPAATSPDVEQHRLFEALRSWLGSAGGELPVVVILDDIHWADQPTLQLLGYVARSAEPSHVVLVCTARNTSPDENEAVGTLAEDLVRRGAPSRRIELSGLGVDDVGELVAAAAGRRLDDRLRVLAAQLQRETAGNPLFVDALLGSLPPDTAWYAPALPGSVAETVRRRLARLPEDVQELLGVASVAGLDFDLRVVARATGHEELAAVATLERATRAGLVHEVGANRYRYAHALVRAALRDDLSESRRVRIHLSIAQALEAVHGADAVEHAGELAHHFSEAVPVGAEAPAYHYALLSAERATGLLAHAEAAVAYRRALELFDKVEQTEGRTRYDLLLALGEALGRAGDFEAAQTRLRAAAEEAAAHAAPEAFARAAVAHEDIGWRPGFPGSNSLDLLERAERALPSDESRLRALTIASLGRALEFSGRRAEGIERSEAAVAMARRVDDPATTAAVLMRAAFSATRIEDVSKLAARCAELRKLARQLGDDELYALGVNHGIFPAIQMADLTAYDELLDEYARAVGLMRQPFWEHPLHLARHLRAFLAGELEEAERWLERSRHVAETITHWDVEGVYGVCMFLLRREQGRLGALVPTLRALVNLHPQGSLWRPGLAALYADLELRDEARAEFEALATADFAAVADDGNREFALCLLAEVSCALGDTERAAWLLDHLGPWEGRLLVFWGNYACLGPADRLLGLLALTCDQAANGERWLDSALNISRRLASPVWTAHCLYDYATRVPVGAPAARSMLAEAAQLCERHSLGALGQRVAVRAG